jgi:hypothetical protein
MPSEWSRCSTPKPEQKSRSPDIQKPHCQPPSSPAEAPSPINQHLSQPAESRRGEEKRRDETGQGLSHRSFPIFFPYILHHRTDISHELDVSPRPRAERIFTLATLRRHPYKAYLQDWGQGPPYPTATSPSRATVCVCVCVCVCVSVTIGRERLPRAGVPPPVTCHRRHGRLPGNRHADCTS